MITYEKPMLRVNEELTEGIYMASGSCYTASGYITQSPQLGRGNYVIHLDARHDSLSSDKHTNDAQTVTVNFNQVVTHVNGGSLKSGNNTSTLVLGYSYHQNATNNIGLSDLIVESDAGLSVVSVTVSDGH